MFLRIDRLPIEMPVSKKVDPQSASAVQELMGGRFGEMSTFANYMFQSMNFRGRDKLRPYYELVANITAEELGHIELIGATVNSLLNGPRKGNVKEDVLGTPLADTANFGNVFNPHHFIAAGQNALPVDSNGAPWTGTYVFSSGNLILDLVHNFFLENAARTNKLRVYEMTKDPAAREMLGYLFVRGGVHAVAYSKAIEKLTGVKMVDLLPLPKIANATFPEAKKWEKISNHTKLYRMSPDDYNNLADIWKGPHPDGGTCEVVDGPPEGGKHVELAGIGASFAPDYQPEEILGMAQKLYKKAQNK